MTKAFFFLGYAAAIALCPLAASAAILNPISTITDGGTFGIAGSPYPYDVTFNVPCAAPNVPAGCGGDPSGSFSFTFTNLTSATPVRTFSTLNVFQVSGSFAGGLTAAWTGGQTVSVAQGVSGGFSGTTSLPPGGSDTLTVTYGSPAGVRPRIELNVGTQIADGGRYDIGSAPFPYDVTFNFPCTAPGVPMGCGDLPAGSFSFTFTNLFSTSPILAISTLDVLQTTGEFAGGVSAAWTGGQSASIAQGASGAFRGQTRLPPGGSDTLTVTYGDPIGLRPRIELDVTAQVVPLPGAAALLLTALGMAVALRRLTPG